ncbi:MAG: SDR family NAD(P)-dependent oxidoreductase [Pseudomonadota bacterium]
MREWAGKRYWLIGASEGLGRSLALAMSKMGCQLVLSARNAERLQALADELPGKAEIKTVDVGDRAALEAAATEIGPIDGMVYLAGVYWPINAKEWNTEQAEAMCDINMMGAIRSVGAVLPAMLERGVGHIVLTGSLSGFRGLPGAVGYGASKAGMMSLAETMRIDLKGTGVEVQLANPGFIRTRLTDKNDFQMPFIMEPEDAAQSMMDLMNSDRFSMSYPWVFASFFRLTQFMPNWMYYRIF